MYKEFDEILKEYRKTNPIILGDDLNSQKIKYVFHSENLEGNSLTYAQTKEIIEHGKIISNTNHDLKDFLTSIGHYKALNHAIFCGLNKYPLTQKIPLEINKLIHKTAWEIDNYQASAKAKGQEIGDFKIAANKIIYSYNGEEGEIIPPNRDNAIKRYTDLLKKVEKSKKHFLSILTVLMYDSWKTQAFFDGNKRTARMLSVYLAQKNNLPIPIYEGKVQNFNSVLVETYKKGEDLNILSSYLEKVFCRAMARDMEIHKELNNNKNQNKGFSFLL